MSPDFWIGIAIGGVGIAIAILAWVKPRKYKPRIVWSLINSVNLINKSVGEEKLKLSYNGKEYKNLSLWTGKIWNSGRKEVRASDLSESKISLIFKDSKVVKASINEKTKEEIDFNIQKSEKDDRVNISFKYLDYGDGAEISVLHTGSKDIKPQTYGTVIGGKVKEASIRFGDKNPILLSLIQIPFATIFFGIIGIVIGIADSSLGMKTPINTAFYQGIQSYYGILFTSIGFLMGLTYFIIALYGTIDRSGEPNFST